jgi:hypothetical protein
VESIQNATAVLAYSFLLCLGLSNATQAENTPSTADDMSASQSEREGGQDGLRNAEEKLKGGYTTGSGRYGGQGGLRSDQDMLTGSHITKSAKSDRDDGQAGLKADQDKLRGLKSSHTIKGEVLSVEGDTYYLQRQDGKAVRLHTDQTTRKIGNIYQRARVEAEVNDRGHALSIRSAESSDRRNEADREG